MELGWVGVGEEGWEGSEATGFQLVIISKHMKAKIKCAGYKLHASTAIIGRAKHTFDQISDAKINEM